MSLVGWWKLDGNAEDSSGNGNNGSENSTGYGEGKIGQGVTSGTVSIPNNPSLQSISTTTISFWIYVNSSSDRRTIIDKAYGGEYTINLETNGNLRFYCGEGGGNSTPYSQLNSSVLSTGEWHHAALVRDGKKATWYIDGKEDTSATSSYFKGSISQNDVTLCKGYTGGIIDAVLDDVRIYDRVLSKKEIKKLSRAKVLHYKFDNFSEYTENMLSRSLREMSGTSGWDESYHSPYSREFVADYDGRDHVYKLNHDGSADGDWYSHVSGLPQTQVGEEYVFSLEYKVTEGSDKPNNPFLYQDGWKSGGEADRELLFDKPIGGGWRRIAHKFTINSSGNPTLRMSTGYTSNKWEVYMDNFQYEKKDHATPFANGKREDEVLDSTGYDNDGQLSSRTPEWIEGSKVGSGAYSFDGGDDRIVVPNSPSLDITGDEITVAYWQRFKDAGDQDHPTVVKNAGTGWGASGGGYAIGHGWSDNLHSGLAGNSLGGQDAGIREDGNWHFVVHTYKDGEGMKVYRNGDLEIHDAGFSGQIGSTSHDLWIGDAERPGAYFGSLDDIRIYATALSQSEIEGLYKQRASIDGGGNMLSHRLIEKDNLVSNPSFEEDSIGVTNPTGWTVEEGSCDIAEKEGRKCVHFPGDGNYHRIRSDWFSVTPGEKIYGRCWRYTENGAIFYFGLSWKSGGWEYFNHPNSDGRWGQLGQSSVTVPEGVTEAGVWVFNYQDNTGDLWVDDVYVSKNPISDGFENKIRSQMNYSSPSITKKGEKVGTQINEVGPAADSLVGHWKLDGDLRDYSGNGNHGANNGATVTSGLGQSAYSFNGSGDYVGLTGSGLPSGSESFTISAWVNIPSSSSSNGGIFGYGNWDSSNQTNAFRRDNSGTGLRHYFWSNDLSTGDIAINDSSWHHVVVRYDGTDRSIFVDRQLESSDSPGSVSMQVQDVNIGVTNSNEYFEGKIQDVRVFNRALTEEEVKILYNLTDPRQDQRVIQSGDGAVYTKGEFDETL